MLLRERTFTGKLVPHGQLLGTQILLNGLKHDLVRTRSWVTWHRIYFSRSEHYGSIQESTGVDCR